MAVLTAEEAFAITPYNNRVYRNLMAFYVGVIGVEVDFVADVTSGVAPLTVEFTPTVAGDDITGWLWTFGDGSTSTTEGIVSHDYTEAGVYNVSLSVTTSIEVTKTEFKEGYITVTAV